MSMPDRDTARKEVDEQFEQSSMATVYCVLVLLVCAFCLESNRAKFRGSIALRHRENSSHSRRLFLSTRLLDPLYRLHER